MNRRLLWALRAGGALAALGLGAVLMLSSAWFADLLRQRVEGLVYQATGGRAGIGQIWFDWRHWSVGIRDFTLHGTEPASAPPLLQVRSVTAGLKIISVLERKVDLASLAIDQPRLHLIVNADGSTNLPSPPTPSSKKNAVETLLDLAVGRLELTAGSVECVGRGRVPFAFQGRDLHTRLLYDRRGPRYRGAISFAPSGVEWPGLLPLDAAVQLAFSIDKSRLQLDSGRIAIGKSEVTLAGSVEDWKSPRARLVYRGRFDLDQVGHLAYAPELTGGTAEVRGEGAWSATAGLTLGGKLNAYRVGYKDSTITARDGKIEGQLTVRDGVVFLKGVQLSADYWNRTHRMPVTGRIAEVRLHERDLEFDGVALAAINGRFLGRIELRQLLYYTITGQAEGLEVRPAVAMYSETPLPWSGLLWGPVSVSGTLRRVRDLRVAADLHLAPAPGSPPARGEISLNYRGAGAELDFAHSAVTLPSSHIELEGAVGRRLHVRLESSDLDDLLPILNAKAAEQPAQLVRGSSLRFEGNVDGDTLKPLIHGHAHAGHVLLSDYEFDSLEADVTLNSSLLRVTSGVLQRGALRSDFDGSMQLDNWRVTDACLVDGRAQARNGPVSDLQAAFKTEVRASGTIAATVALNGTIGAPLLDGDVEVARGVFFDQPFDKFAGHLHYAHFRVDLTRGAASEGDRKLTMTASYAASRDDFAAGRVQWDASSNSLALDKLPPVVKARPGILGTATFTTAGAGEVTYDGKTHGFRLLDLRATVLGRDLALDGQRLGTLRLTAVSEAGLLRAHLDSELARSEVKGDGEWRLEGDYPGTATVQFSRLDYAQVKHWLFSSKAGAGDGYTGSAAGTLRVTGPVLKPKAITADLRMTSFEFGPDKSNSLPDGFSVRSSGPVTLSLASSVITVANAHLVGRLTDLTLEGKITLGDTTGLDLRASGSVDAACLNSFDSDVRATGSVTGSVTIRGNSDAPHATGRAGFSGLSLNVSGVPNDMTNAKGTIAFTDTRATIQSLTGETGGGKVDFTGYVDFTGGNVVFRLGGNAQQVRVRYPEGMSTVANAALSLTGTPARSQISGTITVLRESFNQQSDFGSLMAGGSQPIATPAARSSLLSAMSLDILVASSPDLQVSSGLTQDVRMEGNLRFRGTVASPYLVGRVSVMRGQVVFFGTRFTISQGSISFYNRLRIEPVFNVDLETKARGVDVTLNVSGALGKLSLSSRSDPPLQFSEIVGLLATGSAPNSDSAQTYRESAIPQSYEQMGASAMLGQAVANPVSGRLQRFFGVSRLRIDPTLPGIENNPQARLTLEQQITPDLTFTYITNVTSSNPQVVRVEWAFSKQWSAVALREESGVFGLDFYYKRRF